MRFLVIGLVRSLGFFYSRAPRSFRQFLAESLGGILRLAGLRKGVVRENLEFAFPGADAVAIAQKERLFGRAYVHLAELILEILMVFGRSGPKPGRKAVPLDRFVRQNVVVEGFSNWQEAHDQGKGVIFLSSHVGNWEIMAVTGAQVGIDLMLVTKKIKPEWLHESLENGRLSCGVKATYEPRTFRDVLNHLKKGATVGFVLDQYTGPPVGVRVPFMGVHVGTHSVVATLAKRTGCPVVPVLNYRRADGKHVVRVEPALGWIDRENPQEEIAINTARYAQALETHVLERPEQWLWIHRRFKGDLSPLKPGEWLEGRARR